jgi:hypothetical protein
MRLKFNKGLLSKGALLPPLGLDDVKGRGE